MDIEKMKEEAFQALSEHDFFVEIIGEDREWTISKTKDFIKLQKKIAYFSEVEDSDERKELTWTAYFRKNGELDSVCDDL